MILPSTLRRHAAAFRALAVLTLITGVAYPLVLTGVAQATLPDKADGSLITHGGKVVGSRLIGQSFTDADGNAVLRYFQSRPSSAGDGYDPTATAASNLGPEDVLDSADRQSLLTQVCARSEQIGEREGVSGARPYCTTDGVGAVLKLFPFTGTVTRAVSVNQACPTTPFAADYQGVPIECAQPGEDYSAGRTLPIRNASTDLTGDQVPVPADAVAGSGSGLDPHISMAYARLQIPRVARERGLSVSEVTALIQRYTTGRSLGFMGEPVVNVLELNLALDARTR